MSEQLICVGSYTSATGGKGAGITTFRVDSESGALSQAGTLELASPSWLTWHPALPVLYAANETAEGEVTALAMDPAGALSVLGTASTGGADPCHLAVTPDGGHLLCANYTGGNLAVFSLGAKGEIVERTDLVAHQGSGPDTDRQEAAHVHMVVPNADGSIVSAVDLGTDEIRSYQAVATRGVDAAAGNRTAPTRPQAGHAVRVRRRRARRDSRDDARGAGRDIHRAGQLPRDDAGARRDQEPGGTPGVLRRRRGDVRVEPRP